MPAMSRTWIVLASVLGCLLLVSSEALSAGEQQLGRILYSNATSLRGVAIPESETILSGDVLATSDNGSALVELKSGVKLQITENSSVRFLGDGDKVQAELLAGAVVSVSAGKPTLVVTTSMFQFAPSQEGNCRFEVALSKQQEAVASAMKGNLLVRTPDSLGNYILPEGKYAAFPASSDGFPSQEKAGGGATSAGQAGTVPRRQPPTALLRALPTQLQSQINQTNVKPSTSAAGGPGGPGGAAKVTGHIGSLSEANPILPGRALAFRPPPPPPPPPRRPPPPPPPRRPPPPPPPPRRPSPYCPR